MFMRELVVHRQRVRARLVRVLFHRAPLPVLQLVHRLFRVHLVHQRVQVHHLVQVQYHHLVQVHQSVRVQDHHPAHQLVRVHSQVQVHHVQVGSHDRILLTGR